MASQNAKSSNNSLGLLIALVILMCAGFIALFMMVQLRFEDSARSVNALSQKIDALNVKLAASSQKIDSKEKDGAESITSSNGAGNSLELYMRYDGEVASSTDVRLLTPAFSVASGQKICTGVEMCKEEPEVFEFYAKDRDWSTGKSLQFYVAQVLSDGLILRGPYFGSLTDLEKEAEKKHSLMLTDEAMRAFCVVKDGKKQSPYIRVNDCGDYVNAEREEVSRITNNYFRVSDGQKVDCSSSSAADFCESIRTSCRRDISCTH